MILTPQHRMIWKGNLWSDIAFETSFSSPSSLRWHGVYIELSNKTTKEVQRVPCTAVEDKGGMNHFLFTPSARNDLTLIDTDKLHQTQLSLMHTFSIHRKPVMIGIRVHRNVLLENHNTLRLVFVDAVHSQSTAFKQEENNMRKGSSLKTDIASRGVEIVEFKSALIRITEFKLSIQENFVSSKYVLRDPKGDPDTFLWHRESGGDSVAMNVIIHLKNANGVIVCDYPKRFKVKTELVYEDGRPTPTHPVHSLKNNGSNSKKARRSEKIKLFHPMSSNPILGNGVGSQYFSFRIEEVSSNHKKKGFKLKVSPADDDESSDIYFGVMEETIKVKSKLKQGKGHGETTRGRKSILLRRRNTNTNATQTQAIRSTSKHENRTDLGEIIENKLINVPILMTTQLLTGKADSKCLSCNEYIDPKCGLSPSHHKNECGFRRVLIDSSHYILNTSNSSPTEDSTPDKETDESLAKNDDSTVGSVQHDLNTICAQYTSEQNGTAL